MPACIPSRYVWLGKEGKRGAHLDELLDLGLDPAALRGHVEVHPLRRHVHLRGSSYASDPTRQMYS